MRHKRKKRMSKHGKPKPGGENARQLTAGEALACNMPVKTWIVVDGEVFFLTKSYQGFGSTHFSQNHLYKAANRLMEYWSK